MRKDVGMKTTKTQMASPRPIVLSKKDRRRKRRKAESFNYLKEVV
jgi:hypothetical protein